ncbi:DUF4386 domain-containing protein [bacterium]|nr:MAG: DUF4386 domain-containing protein [bacterium]
MNSNRRAATIAGVLFIIGTVAGILSIAPAIDAPDYLVKASANANQVIIGAFFQFVIATAYVGIAILLYPILRRYNESLALGFLSFRIIAAVFLIIGVTSALLLLALSQEFVKAGALDSSYFQTLGGLLRTGRDLVNHVAMPWTLIVSALMFYFILYQTKLVPRWLSGWGLVGTTVSIWATLLVMFRLIEIITPIYIVLAIPWALQEMVLAVWLIVKGFNPSVAASESEE